ncbi:hypothetical protein ACTXT7_012344 [Hymenolepis weldensis]
MHAGGIVVNVLYQALRHWLDTHRHTSCEWHERPYWLILVKEAVATLLREVRNLKNRARRIGSLYSSLESITFE